MTDEPEREPPQPSEETKLDSRNHNQRKLLVTRHMCIVSTSIYFLQHIPTLLVRIEAD
jgi:hypothetical protein